MRFNFKIVMGLAFIFSALPALADGFTFKVAVQNGTSLYLKQDKSDQEVDSGTWNPAPPADIPINGSKTFGITQQLGASQVFGKFSYGVYGINNPSDYAKCVFALTCRTDSTSSKCSSITGVGYPSSGYGLPQPTCTSTTDLSNQTITFNFDLPSSVKKPSGDKNAR